LPICNITALAAIGAQRIVMKLTVDPRKVVEAFVAAMVSEGITPPQGLTVNVRTHFHV
jgi:hypothetical protein